MQLMSILTFAAVLTLACSQAKFEKSTPVTEQAPPKPATEEAVKAPISPPVTKVDPVVSPEPIKNFPSPELPKKPVPPPTADGKFADCDGATDRPIVADLYQLPPETSRLPDFSKMKAIKKICLTQLDITPRNFSEGFPGVENLQEWFALVNKFQVKVPTAGTWSFRLISDDGAILYIEDQLVIDNDGIHGAFENIKSIPLAARIYPFQVSFFQGPKVELALQLQWKGPNDTEFTYIPKSQLLKPAQ